MFYGKIQDFYSKYIFTVALTQWYAILIAISLSLFQSKASDITGGIYIKTPEPAGLLQFLIVSLTSFCNVHVSVYSHKLFSVTCVLL